MVRSVEDQTRNCCHESHDCLICVVLNVRLHKRCLISMTYFNKYNLNIGYISKLNIFFVFLQNNHYLSIYLSITLEALPYFVNDGCSTGRADGHGHNSPCDSNSGYNKHLTNKAKGNGLAWFNTVWLMNSIFLELKILPNSILCHTSK